MSRPAAEPFRPLGRSWGRGRPIPRTRGRRSSLHAPRAGNRVSSITPRPLKPQAVGSRHHHPRVGYTRGAA